MSERDACSAVSSPPLVACGVISVRASVYRGALTCMRINNNELTAVDWLDASKCSAALLRLETVEAARLVMCVRVSVSVFVFLCFCLCMCLCLSVAVCS